MTLVRVCFAAGAMALGLVGAGADTAFANDLAEPLPAGVLFFEAAADTAEVSLLFLPDDLDASAPNPAAAERLIITGAYSSGDRFAPEGFVIRDGDPTHPWPQGWDGLLLVGADGDAALHDVSAVAYGGVTYNLRDKAERTVFLARAAADKLSAVQSHLLIRDGALDLRPVENAPRFRRRMLFQLDDGRIGVFDTSPRSVTLYEGAAQLLDAVGPAMAINLDMGAYDFCERQIQGKARRCGLLGRNAISRLTNLIALSPATSNRTP